MGLFRDSAITIFELIIKGVKNFPGTLRMSVSTYLLKKKESHKSIFSGGEYHTEEVSIGIGIRLIFFDKSDFMSVFNRQTIDIDQMLRLLLKTMSANTYKSVINC